mmetsp:Transcript_49357/g.120420  ORF Transcript_49357/g.120420 Transcript_49357/m.120420 type:complete len:360 (-) Transcript_49357:2318-3397(-)
MQRGVPAPDHQRPVHVRALELSHQREVREGLSAAAQCDPAGLRPPGLGRVRVSCPSGDGDWGLVGDCTGRYHLLRPAGGSGRGYVRMGRCWCLQRLQRGYQACHSKRARHPDQEGSQAHHHEGPAEPVARTQLECFTPALSRERRHRHSRHGLFDRQGSERAPIESFHARLELVQGHERAPQDWGGTERELRCEKQLGQRPLPTAPLHKRTAHCAEPRQHGAEQRHTAEPRPPLGAPCGHHGNVEHDAEWAHAPCPVLRQSQGELLRAGPRPSPRVDSQASREEPDGGDFKQLQRRRRAICCCRRAHISCSAFHKGASPSTLPEDSDRTKEPPREGLDSNHFEELSHPVAVDGRRHLVG